MFVDYPVWLPDSSGLFYIGGEKSTGRKQVWFQPYPRGEPFKISNDLSEYGTLSITGDGKSFVTTQERRQATIYVGDSPAVLNDKIDWKLTPISTEEATGYHLSWTAAGKLLQEDKAYRVYVTRGDGADRVRLLENTEVAFGPNACGSGDVIVVTRGRRTRAGDRDPRNLQLVSAWLDAGWARVYLCTQYDREYDECLHAATIRRPGRTIDSLRHRAGGRLRLRLVTGWQEISYHPRPLQ